jgi:nuclear transport factor 2 (NTF2) superfamily protein
MMRRFASINDVPIQESERKFRWERTWSAHNKPNAPEQCQAIGELQRVSVSGDWER